MEVIKSIKNPKIQKLVKLIKNKKFRYEQKLFVIEGEHLIEEAKKSGLLIELFISRTHFEKYPKLNGHIVNDKIFNQITSFKNYFGLIGICKFFDNKFNSSKNCLILDNISDPGNLGTLIRSAAAFDFTNILLINNCVDVFNPKVVSSTQGYLLKVNIIFCDYEQIDELIKQNYKIYGTYLEEKNTENYYDLKINNSDRIAILIGNESKGLDLNLKKYVYKNVNIPIYHEVESLNAAVAGSIIMSYFKIA